MATEQDVLNILGYVAAAWPRTEMTEETVAVYVMHLLRARLAADVLLLAAMRLVESSAFPPSVAELLAAARGIESERRFWCVTANYRLTGMLPEELVLPPGLAQNMLGYEIAPDIPLLEPEIKSAAPRVIPGRVMCRAWEAALDILECQVSRSAFDAYLRPTTAVEQGDELTVYTRDLHASQWLGNRLHPLVERSVREAFGRPMSIRYSVQAGHLGAGER